MQKVFSEIFVEIEIEKLVTKVTRPLIINYLDAKKSQLGNEDSDNQ